MRQEKKKAFGIVSKLSDVFNFLSLANLKKQID